MGEKFKVIIRRCEDYADGGRLRSIIREGLAELGEKPRGKVLLKPNLIFAHSRYGRFGYTEPRVMDAIIDVLGALPEVEKITIGERTAVTVPTRYVYNGAGYGVLTKKPKVELCFFEEARLKEVPLKKGVLHKSLMLAEALADADYKVWAPKLKHHASSKLTHALKLNIGILNADERLVYHDWRLETKIADLYEAGYPDLVISDSIMIGQQGELVPKPLHLGVIMMSNNGIAIDSVGARIIGFTPDQIEHLRIARARGWEPVSDDQIEIVGDVGLDELRARTQGFDRTFSDPQTVDTPIRFFIGPRPGGPEVCDTGCVNMIKTCLAVMDAYAPGAIKTAAPVAVVIGEYEGDVDGMGHPILLVGDCTKVRGKVTGTTRRVGGCPTVVPVFMNYGAHYFKVPNPYFDPGELLSMPYQMARSWAEKIRNRGLWNAKFLS